MATHDPLPLGNFSVSLAVNDLAASRAFYEKLGFSVFGGDPAQNWLILQNGATTIGLFHGMFERNMLTFNPGWDAAANTLPQFIDVRELQRRVKQAGIVPSQEADESGQGPASFMVVDPDGNPILFVSARLTGGVVLAAASSLMTWPSRGSAETLESVLLTDSS